MTAAGARIVNPYIAAMTHSRSTVTDGRTIVGRASVRRVGEWPFRHDEIQTASGVAAKLGRGSFFRTYFGRGRRVQLRDGSRWRLAAVTRARWICPAVFNESGQKVAVSGPLAGSTYGISTKHDGYTLVPAARATWRTRIARWHLELHDQSIATLTLRPKTVNATQPVPTAVILVAFTLMEHGMPGESELGIPGFTWEQRYS